MRHPCWLLLLAFGACSSLSTEGDAVSVVPKKKNRLMTAGLLPGGSIPAERDGMRADDTGAILFVCANSGRHEDKEVFIESCPCGERNYFYWDHARGGFTCYACTKPFPDELVKCGDCGKVPRRVRTRVTKQ
jgi:hypothetical protein